MRKHFFTISLWAIAAFFVLIVVLQIIRRKQADIKIPRIDFHEDGIHFNGKRYLIGNDRKVDFPDTPICWMPGAKAILPKDSVRVDTLVSTIPASVRSTFPKYTYLKIDVPYGTRYKVLLYDSSTALLDGGTSFYVPLSFDTFRVVKVEGRGYFNVKENNTRPPLSVQTNDAAVAASAGQFEIMADSAHSCSIANLNSTVIVFNEKNGKAVLGPFLRFRSVEDGNWESSVLDPSFVPVWVLDEIGFDNEPIGIILLYAAMRYDVKFVVEGENVVKLPLTLHFDWSTTLEEFIHLLANAGKLSCRIEGENVTICSKDEGR